MADRTEIAYADHTKSPWRGCEKCSPGCKNCYVEALQRKFGDKLTDRRLVASFDKDARRWNKKPWICDVCGSAVKDASVNSAHYPHKNQYTCPSQEFHRARVFVSICDPFDDQVPLEWFNSFMVTVDACRNLAWLLLTKRPENVMTRWEKVCEHWGRLADHSLPPNVWLGVSVEDRDHLDRIAFLPDSACRWVSFAPLLEHLGDGIGGFLLQHRIQWAVIEGETASADKRRDCGVEAITNLALQCVNAHIPVWVKQDVGLHSGQQGRIPDEYWALKEVPAL